MLNTFTTNFQDRFNTLPFRAKAIAAAVVLTLLPVVGVGTLAYLVSQNNLREAEIVSQKAASKALSVDIARFLTLRGKDIQTLAELPLVKNATVAKTLTKQYKENFLNSYLERYKIYDSVSIVDLNGENVAASKGETLKNISNRDYFITTIKTGKPYISNAEASQVTKKLSIFFTAPVRDEVTGQITAIIRARMPVLSLQAIAAPFGEEGSDWHIADNKTGKYVLVPEGEDATDANEFKKFNELKNSEKPQSDIGYSSVSKQSELTSFVKVPTGTDLPDVNLSIVLSKKMSLLQAKENNVLLVLLAGMLVTGGATIGLSLLLSDRVTKFIQLMADSISKSSGEIVDTVEMQEVTVNMQATPRSKPVPQLTS